MALAINLRKMLHRKAAEYCCPLPFSYNSSSGGFAVSDKSDAIPAHDIAYYVRDASTILNYNADNDAWLQLPASGIAGSFGAGSCGEFRAMSCPGGNPVITATAGTTTTLTTNLTITRNLAGVEIMVIGGTGAGYSGKIKSNTIGTNAVITVETASAVAFSATTQFRIYGGSLWFFNAGTSSVGFAVYDRITNIWTQRSVTGLPTSWGTEGQLVSTPGRTSNKGRGFVNGTATAGGATTLTTNKTFVSNQWANSQVRIVQGTGAGQIRTIASNTAGANSVLTVSSAWTTNPDATSVYRIEGNDDHFYLLGNNSVNMYRYSISGNSWTTLAPTNARNGAPGAGMTADWIDCVLDPEWQEPGGSYAVHYGPTSILKQNGRYLYCFRAGGTATLDIYDIALNSWSNGVPYGNANENFSSGSSSVDLNGVIYLQKDVQGRIFSFDVASHVLNPFVFNPVPQGTTVAGDKMFMTTYADGGTELNYLYTLAHTRGELVRWVVI